MVSLNDTVLNISGFLPESITDGPGVRSVLFLQGCPHHCKGCHNPKTWDYEPNKMWTVEYIFNKLKANAMIKGITFSGGEPMEQSDKLIVLAKLCKKSGYNIMMYTGYVYEVISDNPIFEYIDYVVDGPFKLSLRSLDCLYRGSTNQRIIDVAASRKAGITVEVDYDTFGADILC